MKIRTFIGMCLWWTWNRIRGRTIYHALIIMRGPEGVEEHFQDYDNDFEE